MGEAGYMEPEDPMRERKRLGSKGLWGKKGLNRLWAKNGLNRLWVKRGLTRLGVKWGVK